MGRSKIASKRIGVCLAAAVGGMLVAAGCATTDRSGGAATTRPAMGAGASQESHASRQSGAQLWAEYCMRCHNLRSPEQFGPGQWEVAVHHMRQRANLTGEEARKITEFLKAAS